MKSADFQCFTSVDPWAGPESIVPDKRNSAMLVFVLSSQSNVVLYERIERPAYLLNRWFVHHRAISNNELVALATEMFDVLDSVAAVPLPDAELQLGESQDSEARDLDSSESIEVVVDDPASIEVLDVLLSTVRRTRRVLSKHSDAFVRVLRSRRLPDKANAYMERLRKADDRICDVEKALILLGAGTDEDASLIMDLMPETRFDLPSGASVPFEL